MDEISPKKKRYWLRAGLIFFVLTLVLSLYASFTIIKNVPQIYTTGQEQSFDINRFVGSIPGFQSLVVFGYSGGFIGFLIGSIILSLLYGLVGAFLGLIYSKIKSKR